MKVDIHLVTHNGAAYIPYLFASLRQQTFQDFRLSVLDNASQDNTVSRIIHELADVPFAHRHIQNKENLGFAKGHNMLISQSQTASAPYLFLLNQDM